MVKVVTISMISLIMIIIISSCQCATKLDDQSMRTLVSTLKAVQGTLNTLIDTLGKSRWDDGQESPHFEVPPKSSPSPSKSHPMQKSENEFTTPPKTTTTFGVIKPFRCSASFAGVFNREPRRSAGDVCSPDFTLNMLEGRWSSSSGWEPTYIVPYGNLTLSPSARVLLHGQQVFDVIQATMGFDNRIRLFRPENHLKRLRKAATALALPEFDEDELLICIRRLVLSDAAYLPPSYTNGSLEIRVVLASTEANTEIGKNKEAILYAFMVRHHHPSVTRLKANRAVYADPLFTRTWEGGLGQYKTVTNYAITIPATEIAHSLGCNDVLWLSGKQEDLLELNEANIFVYFINDRGRKELVTPPLNGLIVPGVVRQSVLEMTRYWNEFLVTERSMTIHELQSLHRQHRLLEVFATNTLGNVIPVVRIHYAPSRTEINVPTLEQRSPIYKRLNRAFYSIEFGLVDHPWGLVV